MLVWDYPETIKRLVHNQSWASDSAINEALLKVYAGYEYLYSCANHNSIVLESKIIVIHDRMEEYYKTLHYDYNPIENYNMTEEEDSTGETKRTDDLASSAETTGEGYGFNDGANSTPLNKASSETTNTGTQEQASKGKRKLTRKGNIGVQTTQEMVLKQRSLLDSMIDAYTREFADCFDLSNVVSHGDPWRRY